MFIALFIHPKSDIDYFLNESKFIELLNNSNYMLNIYYTQTKMRGLI